MGSHTATVGNFAHRGNTVARCQQLQQSSRRSSFGSVRLSTASPAFVLPTGAFPGADDPVVAERRSRRRRAVIAGLAAIVLLGGGLAGVGHLAPSRPSVVKHQVNSEP